MWISPGGHCQDRIYGSEERSSDNEESCVELGRKRCHEAAMRARRADEIHRTGRVLRELSDGLLTRRSDDLLLWLALARHAFESRAECRFRRLAFKHQPLFERKACRVRFTSGVDDEGAAEIVEVIREQLLRGAPDAASDDRNGYEVAWAPEGSVK